MLGTELVVTATLCFVVKIFTSQLTAYFCAFLRKEVVPSHKKLSWADID